MLSFLTFLRFLFPPLTVNAFYNPATNGMSKYSNFYPLKFIVFPLLYFFNSDLLLLYAYVVRIVHVFLSGSSQSTSQYATVDQWQSELENVVTLYKFNTIIIINFFRNIFFLRPIITKTFAYSMTKL